MLLICYPPGPTGGHRGTAQDTHIARTITHTRSRAHVHTLTRTRARTPPAPLFGITFYHGMHRRTSWTLADQRRASNSSKPIYTGKAVHWESFQMQAEAHFDKCNVLQLTLHNRMEETVPADTSSARDKSIDPASHEGETAFGKISNNAHFDSSLITTFTLDIFSPAVFF